MFDVSVVKSNSSIDESLNDFVDHIDRIAVASFPSHFFWVANRAARRKWWRLVIADPEAMVVATTRREDALPLGFAVCFLHEDGICLTKLSKCAPSFLQCLSLLLQPARVLAYLARKLRARAFDSDQVEIERPQPVKGREMFVYQFAVCPTARGQGLAKELMRATIQAAAERRCEWLGLRVEAANLPAINLYRAAGLRVSKADRAGLKMVGSVESILKSNFARVEVA